jgi:hypothetical protein
MEEIGKIVGGTTLGSYGKDILKQTKRGRPLFLSCDKGCVTLAPCHLH